MAGAGDTEANTDDDGKTGGDADEDGVLAGEFGDFVQEGLEDKRVHAPNGKRGRGINGSSLMPMRSGRVKEMPDKALLYNQQQASLVGHSLKKNDN